MAVLLCVYLAMLLSHAPDLFLEMRESLFTIFNALPRRLRQARPAAVRAADLPGTVRFYLPRRARGPCIPAGMVLEHSQQAQSPAASAVLPAASGIAPGPHARRSCLQAVQERRARLKRGPPLPGSLLRLECGTFFLPKGSLQPERVPFIRRKDTF